MNNHFQAHTSNNEKNTEPKTIQKLQVCDQHYVLVNKINEVNNRLEYLMKVKWSNGDSEVQEIPLNRAIEFLLYDIKEVKKNTALWMDSTKIIKSIGAYAKKHKYFIMILAGIILLILSKEWFYKFINVLYK
jgi:hypothetical protein